MLFSLCSAVLMLALLAGGGTHVGFYGDVSAQILSIPLLMAALWPAFGDDCASKKRARIALVVCAVCAAAVFVQVFPLPFDIWNGRKALFPGGDVLHFAGLSPGWSTLSMTPQATWAAAVSLLVPLSIFGVTLQLGLKQRMLLCRLLLGAGVASLGMGLLQVAQGPDSALRFYEVTNPTEAVGFFANRNHFAALLNVTLVLSALWLTQTLEAFMERRTLNTRAILWLATASVLFVATLTGLIMARSRAGAFLGIAALGAIWLMIRAHARSLTAPAHPVRTTRMNRVPLAVFLFAALFALQFALGSLLTRFEGDPFEDLRLPLNATVLETAFKALPFGTGLGSFVPVYATVEKGQDTFDRFVHRAHNDLAELFLETGVVGAVFGFAFLAWFGWRARAIWVKAQPAKDHQLALLERASSLAVALLLFHSLVDYPLRTTALSAVFAFFCGILAAPIGSAPVQRQQRRRRKERPQAETLPLAVQTDDIHWPESWRR